MPCVKASEVCSQSSDVGSRTSSSTRWGTIDPWTIPFSPVEREFLLLVQNGSEEEILEYMLKNPNMDLDSHALKGQYALEIAVTSRSIEILRLLLTHFTFGAKHLRFATIQAVEEDDMEMLEVLLDEYEKIKTDPNEVVDTTDGPASLIPVSNLTAIMKAAILGNMDMIRLLLDRDYTIKKPHYHRCKCAECIVRNEKGERLSESLARINAYKALANPNYIIVTSTDPILTAFELSQELSGLLYELPEHQGVYNELSEQCSKFAADLLNQCCDTREVQVVLMQKAGYPDPRPHQFSRLRLAILYQQKEFVAHPSCQQVLRSMWVQGLPKWWSWSTYDYFVHVTQHVLLFPFICLAFVLAPFPSVKRRMNVPFNKFIYSCASYLLFLSLLLSTLISKTEYDPNKPIAWNKVAVAVWIVGHSWELLVNLCLLGVKTFLRSWWAVYDLLMFSLFLIAQLLWLIVFIFERLEIEVFLPMRKEWQWYHPYLIGEGVYAIASILSVMRLILWYQLSPQLGTLSISLRYMIGDVSKFLLLILIVMFAFMVGINSLYGDYRGLKHVNDEGKVEEQKENFATILDSFRTVFWALFGMGEADSTILLPISGGNNTEEIHHVFTQYLGSSLWGIYHIITVVILINMLIAMLSSSYEKVNNNADVEWKYARSSILLHFLDTQSTVPPPFNLIPTIGCISSMCQCCYRTVTRRSRMSPYNFLQRCFFEEKKAEKHLSNLEDAYTNLLFFLVHRYLHSKELRCDRPTPLIPADVMERLKLEILEDLKKTVRKDVEKGKRRSATSNKFSARSSSSTVTSLRY